MLAMLWKTKVEKSPAHSPYICHSTDETCEQQPCSFVVFRHVLYNDPLYLAASAPLKDDFWKETYFIETCKNSNYITEKWIPFGKFDHVLVKMLPSGEAWITASLICMGIQIPDAYSKLIWYIIQQVQLSK